MMRKGWSREDAIAIAANLQTESGLNPTAQGDKDKKTGIYQAYGLAQWHPDRQANFKKAFGKDIKSASYAEQLDFVDYELRKGSERSMSKALSRAGSVGEKAAALSKLYERPADKSGEMLKRARLAEKMASVSPSYNNLPASATNSNSTTYGQIVVYTQATDAQGIANALPRALANQSESGAF